MRPVRISPLDSEEAPEGEPQEDFEEGLLQVGELSEQEEAAKRVLLAKLAEQELEANRKAEETKRRKTMLQTNLNKAKARKTWRDVMQQVKEQRPPSKRALLRRRPKARRRVIERADQAREPGGGNAQARDPAAAEDFKSPDYSGSGAAGQPNAVEAR